MALSYCASGPAVEFWKNGRHFAVGLTVNEEKGKEFVLMSFQKVTCMPIYSDRDIS